MATIKIALLSLAIVATALFTGGCTKYHPRTGQQEVDAGATAGVAGLALGAAALGVAASNRNDYYRRDVVAVNRPPVYRPYRGGYYQGGRKGGFYRR
ncbi:MAG: hypothetical protein NTX45_17420 [Proteobacteria bacterium]|nr:hypothetical protein [Pseudomonadota bacterium]